jgi:hydroxyacylglutathione hydrolase
MSRAILSKNSATFWVALVKKFPEDDPPLARKNKALILIKLGRQHVAWDLCPRLTARTGDAMTAQIHQFLCLTDNFGVLLHDLSTRATVAVDAPDAAPILAALAAREWVLTDILITHHHFDHIQGIVGLKARFPRARVIGPAKEAAKIGRLDLAVEEGSGVMTGALEARVIEVPGHTSGHVAYWFVDEDILFAGDTLFAMGCGRALEERPEVLFHSLMKLAALPPETQFYCGHEYTLANARFALAVDDRDRACDQSVSSPWRSRYPSRAWHGWRRSHRDIYRIARTQEPAVSQDV